MKHKVSELDGALLDAAVAKAVGIPLVLRGGAIVTDSYDEHHLAPAQPYSRLWALGGPIIERERITVQAAQAGDWRAFLGDGTTNAGTGRRASAPMIQERGDTPLIAAMRAYVASKLGETVTLP